jgi:hypothetical protein
MSMRSSLIYECPVDHHTAGDWPNWSNSILSRIEAAVAPREKIEVGSEPIFRYGRSAGDSIEWLQNFDVGDGGINIQWWSSIVFYSAFSVTAGNGINTADLKKSLRDFTLLNESGDCAGPENARLFVYYFHARDDYPKLASASFPIKERIYVGPEWPIEDAEDEPDWRGEYVIDERFPEGIIAFYPVRDEPEAELWMKASGSDGLLMLEKGNGVWRRLGSEFAELRDMALLLGGDDDDAALSVGRCHMDDALLCAYNMGPVRELKGRLCLII